MKIWMFAVSALQIVYYSRLHPWPWAAGFILASAFCCLVWRSRFKNSTWGRLSVQLGWLAVFFCAGAILNTLTLQSIIGKQLPLELDHQTGLFRFEVISLVEQSARSQVFTGRILGADCPGRPCQSLSGEKVRLSWYQTREVITSGELWQAELKLRRPRGFLNPGGFDYQAWLLSQGVAATGYIKDSAQQIGTVNNWAKHRQNLRSSIVEVSANDAFARFWLALVLADRSQISADDWDVLQKTGTVHLMAISGLHIGLVALLMHWLGLTVARLANTVMQPHRSGVAVFIWLPAILSLLGALYYAALAGFSVPTLRALLACLAVQGSRLLGWRVPPLTLVGLALSVVLLSDPMAAALPGFWLSFGAVLCLLFIMQVGVGATPSALKIVQWGRVQWTLCMAMGLPLLIFGQFVSLSAPVANFVAVPALSFLVVPTLLVASLIAQWMPSVAAFLLSLADHVFGWVWQYLAFLAALPEANWWPAMPMTATVALSLGLALILVASPAAYRVRSLGWLLIGVIALVPKRPVQDVQLTVMDVGQGSAMLLQVEGRALLFDAGPRFSESFDAGSRIVLPYLRQLGVQSMDLIVSHDDLDHSGGAPSLVASMPIERSYFGEHLEALPEQSYRPCAAGDRLSLGRAKLRVLWPRAGTQKRGNDASCVILVQFADSVGVPQSILFTGDISAAVETEILSELPSDITVLIAPHHGSASSSSFAFVRKVSPQYVVYATGYRNGYNHPHGTVSRRYQREGAVELNTAHSGALIFHWRDGELEVIESRKVQARPWYW